MSGAFDAGTVTGRLVLDLQQWTASVETAKKDTQSLAGLVASKQAEIEKLGKAFTFAGAAIVGALGLAVKSAMDFTLEAGKMATKTGIAVETISGLREAADDAEVSMEELGGGFRRYAAVAADAANGNKQAKETLDKLGISVLDSSGKLRSMDDLLMEAADRFSKMEDGTEKAALAQDLFGRGGAALIPLLNKGSEGIKAYTEDVRKSGQMVTAEGVEKARAFRIGMDNLDDAFMAVKMNIATALMPVIQALSSAFTFVIGNVRALLNVFPPLGGTITVVVGAMGALMAILGPMLLALPKLASMWNNIIGLIPVLQARLAALKLSLGFVSAAFVALVAGIKIANWAIDAYSKKCDEAIANTVNVANQEKKSWEWIRETIQGATTQTSEAIKRAMTRMREMGYTSEEMVAAITAQYGHLINKTKQVAADTAEMADKIKDVMASLADKIVELTSNEFNYRIYQAKKYYADLLEQAKGSVQYAKIEADAKKALALEVGKIRREQAEASAEKEKQTAEKSRQAGEKMWKAWEDGCINAGQTINQVMFKAAQSIAGAQRMVLNAMGPFFQTIISTGTETGTKVQSKFQKSMEKIGGYVQILQQGFGQFFSALGQLSQQRYDNEMSLLQSEYEKKKKQIEDSLMSEEEKKAALLALDEKYQEDQKALKQSQLETQKRASIIQALMNMAAAITASFASLGWPLGAIGAAIAAAACAIQIKAIKAQRVELAEGGVADRPTSALVGEAGPEAIIPLRELGRMLGIDRKQSNAQMNIHFNIQALDGADVERITRRKIMPELQRMIKREAFTVSPNAVRY